MKAYQVEYPGDGHEKNYMRYCVTLEMIIMSAYTTWLKGLVLSLGNYQK